MTEQDLSRPDRNDATAWIIRVRRTNANLRNTIDRMGNRYFKWEWMVADVYGSVKKKSTCKIRRGAIKEARRFIATCLVTDNTWEKID